MAVIAISSDPVDDLASWAADADFPQLFASDLDGQSFRAFGVGVRESGSAGSRMVAVIDPEGVVSYVASPFREIDPAAYDELGQAVAAVAPPLEAEGEDGGSTEEVLQAVLPSGGC